MQGSNGDVRLKRSPLVERQRSRRKARDSDGFPKLTTNLISVKYLIIEDQTIEGHHHYAHKQLFPKDKQILTVKDKI